VIVSLGYGNDCVYWDIPYTMDADGDPTLGQPAEVEMTFQPHRGTASQEAMSRTDHGTEVKAVAQAAKGAAMNDLPDSAFAFLETGGMLDEEQKTIPRSHRHVPHHDQSGEVDISAVTAFLEAPGDDQKAIAHMMAHAWDAGLFGLKSQLRAGRSGGASQAFLEIAYKALLLADRTAEDVWAMSRSGLDSKDGARLYERAQVETRELADLATQILKRAQEIDRGEDGAALASMWRTAFELLDLEEVA
jgi:hypothetical protein